MCALYFEKYKQSDGKILNIFWISFCEFFTLSINNNFQSQEIIIAMECVEIFLP